MSYRHLRFPGGKPRAVTFSYDDGVKADIKLASIINKYGIKCTFNHNNFKRLAKEEVIESIISYGHEIAVHGADHKAEGIVRPIDMIKDVLSCREFLESEFNMIIRGMAYPDSGIRVLMPGNTYEDIKSRLIDLDIAYARTLGEDNNSFRLPSDFYAWAPTAHHNNPKIFEYIEEFLSADYSDKVYSSKRYPRLFYVWGHSYEFDRDDNWELLEEICRKISGKPDIWYATNIEIYNYVKAFNSLEYSADGRIIHNPTFYAVWFEDEDGKLRSVNPGETIQRVPTQR